MDVAFDITLNNNGSLTGMGGTVTGNNAARFGINALKIENYGGIVTSDPAFEPTLDSTPEPTSMTFPIQEIIPLLVCGLVL